MNYYTLCKNYKQIDLYLVKFILEKILKSN